MQTYVYELYVPETMPFEVLTGEPGGSAESIHRQVREGLTQYFSGFTVLTGRGQWQGVREDVRVYRIISDALDAEDRIETLAHWVKDRMRQDCVLWTRASVEGNMV